MNATNIFSKSWRILPWKPLHPGEGLIAWGLLFAAAAVAWLHFVMGFILALPSAAIAIILLALGIPRARHQRNFDKRQCVGMLLLFFGIISLIPAAFKAASLSYKIALGIHHSSMAANVPLTLLDFAWVAAFSIPPILLLPAGLQRWTDWSPRRQKIWKTIFAITPLIALIIHQILSAIGAPLIA